MSGFFGKDRRQLDFEELEDFEAALKVALAGELRAKEREFVMDMAKKLETWGQRLSLSPKQWEWLMSIADRNRAAA